MTSYFPHTAYAEDQPNAHAILYVHVVRATAMTSSLVGYITAPSSLLIARYHHARPITSTAFVSRLLTHSGNGLAIGSVIGVAATYGWMFGRNEVEWQDRAWRLQENAGENGTDVVSLRAAAAGAVVAGLAARGGRLGGLGVGRAAFGGAGVGMAGGVGYMVATFAGGRTPA